MSTNEPILIQPESKTIWMKLRFLSPVSHHDPRQAGKSNFSLFRRQGQLVELRDVGRLVTGEEVTALCEALPMPADLAPAFDETTLPQFVAAALIKLFAEEYAGEAGEGMGIFEGPGRWDRLYARFQQAAIRSNTLGEFWSVVCREMQVPMSGSARDRTLLRLLRLPSSLAGLVLYEIAHTTQWVVALGRQWVHMTKLQNPAYAEKANEPPGNPENVMLSLGTEEVDYRKQIKLMVPAYSSNSVRHEIVREPSMWHLLRKLDIPFDSLPPGVAALLYNGNNIGGGVSAPTNAFGLAQIIRDTYPSLSLVCGTTDTFFLGQSNLNVNCWVVCRENNDALVLADEHSNISIFDMLDEESITRQAGRVGRGQMPVSFEVLIKGVPLLVRLTLTPYVRPLEIGALVSAIDTYLESDGTLGGQSARGFGMLKLMYSSGIGLEEREMQEAYEIYLEENADKLCEGLLAGTLGTDRVVCR